MKPIRRRPQSYYFSLGQEFTGAYWCKSQSTSHFPALLWAVLRMRVIRPLLFSLFLLNEYFFFHLYFILKRVQCDPDPFQIKVLPRLISGTNLGIVPYSFYPTLSLFICFPPVIAQSYLQWYAAWPSVQSQLWGDASSEERTLEWIFISYEIAVRIRMMTSKDVG